MSEELKKNRQNQYRYRMWTGTKRGSGKMIYGLNVIECLQQQIAFNIANASNAAHEAERSENDYVVIGFDHEGEYGSVFMQCTGLHDKYGKDIYEGDYWRVECGEAYVNGIHRPSYCEGQISIDEFGVHIGTKALWANSHIFRDGIGEVVGNIYENRLLSGATFYWT